MSAFCRFMVALITVFVVSDPLSAQWTRTSSVPGGYVLCFASSGSRIYVGTDGGGVYVSTDDGSTWNPVNNGLENFTINALAVSGTDLFAAAGDLNVSGKVYRSTDDGASWAVASEGLPNDPRFYWQIDCFTVAPNGQGSTKIFVGLYDGVYVSTNNGVSWFPDTTALLNKYGQSLTFSDTNLYVGTLAGVYRSTTNLTPWIRTANEDMGYMPVTSLVAQDSFVLASGFGRGVNGIFRSTNYGSSWSLVYGEGSYSLFDTVDPLGPMARMNSEIFAGTSKGRIIVSDDEGRNWSLRNTIPKEPPIRAFFVKDSAIFAGSYGLGIYYSTDRGLTWTPKSKGLGNTKVQAIALTGGNIFAGTSAVGVFRSSDNGTSWVQVNNGLSNLNVVALAATESSLFASAQGDICKTTDNGAHWSVISSGTGHLWGTAALAVIDSRLFAGTRQFGVFCSTNEGATWDSASNRLAHDIVTALAASKANLFAGLYHSGVWSSTDYGNSWNDASTGITDPNIVAVAVNGTDLYANTRSGNLFVSRDNAATWAKVDSNTMNVNILALAANATDLYAGTTSYGVMYRPVSGITSMRPGPSPLPKQFVLCENYPNPFNPTTTIQYELPVQSYVTLKVYTLLGQEVAKLVDETRPAGYYSVAWDASRMASGVYIYVLQAGSLARSRKLILLR